MYCYTTLPRCIATPPHPDVLLHHLTQMYCYTTPPRCIATPPYPDILLHHLTQMYCYTTPPRCIATPPYPDVLLHHPTQMYCYTTLPKCTATPPHPNVLLHHLTQMYCYTTLPRCIATPPYPDVLLHHPTQMYCYTTLPRCIATPPHPNVLLHHPNHTPSHPNLLFLSVSNHGDNCLSPESDLGIVNIHGGGTTPTAGSPYTLTCTVPVIGWNGSLTIQLTSPNGSVHTSHVVSASPGMTYTLQWPFYPLRASDGGQYTCHVSSPKLNTVITSSNINVTSMCRITIAAI